MARYLIRQTLLSLIKLLVFLTFMFFFIQVMMPGDFVDQFSLLMDASQREELRVQLGLDLPILQRYVHWMGQLIHLDLGQSLTGQPIVEMLKQVIPPTLLVFLTGTILAFLTGLWLGKTTAWRHSSWLSRLTTLGGITLYTSFPPWLAWLVIYLLAGGVGFEIMGEVGGLRGVSFQGLSNEIWRATEIHPSVIAFRMVLTGLAVTVVFLFISALVKRFTGFRIPGLLLLLLVAAGTVGLWYLLKMDVLAFDIAQLAWQPILIYLLLSFGETMIIMQSSMTDVMKEEYINTARAKGLSETIVREKHAARNALLPVLSRLVISLPYLLTGVVIIESAVAWPGMGTNMWNALYWQNMPVVMATLLIVGLISLLARLILDVATAYLDPRIRFDQKSPSAV
ncbi:ABC transporter permease [Chloroflexota bacterium]